jgi:NAD(P)-dependent dehydrogenase (short-subunit alcohol dehydrogenase family)
MRAWSTTRSPAVPSVLASGTKGGLNAAAKSLAFEYAKRGVRVSAVALGIIQTPMHSVQTCEQFGALHPGGYRSMISDIVGTILYLESASFVTGEILYVDDRQSAGH